MNRKRIVVRGKNPADLRRKLNSEIQKAQREAANEIRKEIRKAFR